MSNRRTRPIVSKVKDAFPTLKEARELLRERGWVESHTTTWRKEDIGIPVDEMGAFLRLVVERDSEYVSRTDLRTWAELSFTEKVVAND